MTLLGWSGYPAQNGDAPVLVLLPSLGTTVSLFDDLVRGMRSRLPGLEVVLVDLPGHGSAPLSRGFSVLQLADEVSQTIQSWGASSVTVAGVSMGGAIALETARLEPSGLERFAMINSSPRFGSAHGWEVLIDTVAASGMRGLVADSAAGWFSDSFRSNRRARHILASIEDIDPDSYVACCRALQAYDGRGGASMVSLTAALIGTADDTALPPLELRGLNEILPRSTYTELPTGRHLSLVEHSASVQSLLLDLMAA